MHEALSLIPAPKRKDKKKKERKNSRNQRGGKSGRDCHSND
jgi:hypothetical protein